jgi:NifB/MoaA-like Fe-S oxidoreductase
MAPLFPAVLTDLAARTGGTFEVLAVENAVFGPSVTTAGLLPGAAIGAALAQRRDLDLALLPAEAVNDDGRFIDDLAVAALTAEAPMEVRLSADFADALAPAAAEAA